MKIILQKKSYANSYSLNYIRLFFLFVLTISFGRIQSQDLGSKTEALWSKLDFEQIQRNTMLIHKIPKNDSVLFFQSYIAEKLLTIQNDLSKDISKGLSNDTLIKKYTAKVENKYITEYPNFLSGKQAYITALNFGKNAILRVESVNEPCTNMSFEQKKFDAWEGNMQVINTDTDRNKYPPTNGPIQTGFLQHCIMTPGLTDPYIAGLSVVPPLPAPQTAVRLGNVVSGGHQATISQTFLVTPDNVLFTYRYAVVLEDPVGSDANGHQGLNAPHFQAILTDQNNDTIKCAKYSVVVATNLSGFNFYCERDGDIRSAANIGCPASAGVAGGYDGSNPFNPSPATLATGSTCTAGAKRSFYWKNWTTITIPLDNYIGQNVTITFTAADCSPGAHLGYAYVQAQCNPLPLPNPGYICSGKQTRTLSAPDGFASYNWSGPGIVGASNKRTITVNKSGEYKMILVPLSDLPCPDTFSVSILEHCAPAPYSVTLCESTKGTGKATNINLNSYKNNIVDTTITDTATITEWHTALPATAANKITNPKNITASNGGKYYAIVVYNLPTTIGIPPIPNDTVALSFVINSLPNIVFPTIPNSCIGAPTFQISGVTPTGGIFSGPNVTSSGMFNPISVGKDTIKYKVTNAQGCTDSTTRVATVVDKPTVKAFKDTSICFQNASISLPISTIFSGDSATWSTTFGTIANRKSSSTTLTITGAAPMDKTISLVATAYRNPCATASSPIKIIVHQLPKITMPTDTLICTDGSPISTLAKSQALYQDSIRWKKSSGIKYTDSSTLTTTVTLANTYPQKITDTLTLFAYKQTCPLVKGSYRITINPYPKVQAPKDTAYCANATNISLKGTSQGTDSVRWSVIGFSGSFSSPSSLVTNFIRTGTKTGTSVTFQLTGYTKNCGQTDSSVKISLEALPTISISKPDSVCANQPIISASASMAFAGGVAWISGGGIFSPDSSQSTVQYTASNSEITSGFIVLKAVTTPTIQQLCPMARDSVKVPVSLPPTLQLPSDTTLCFGNNPTNLLLTSIVSNEDSLIWNTSNAIIPNKKKGRQTSLSITNSNTFKVIATAYKNGCNTIKDSLNVSLDTPPSVSFNPDSTCLPNLQVNLTGLSQIAGINNPAVWSTSGTGSFTYPITRIDSNFYIPSKADSALGKVKLSLISTTVSTCPVSRDSVIWRIIALPKAFAGNDSIVCINANISPTTMTNSDWKYEWRRSRNGAVLSSTKTLTFNADLDTNNVYVTVLNSRKCVEKDSSVYTTITPPNISLPSKICLYTPQTINAIVSNTPSLGNYDWRRNDTSLSVSNSSLLLDKIATYSYHYSFNGTCTSSNKIETLKIPELVVHDTSACQNGNTAFVANLITGANYYWGPSAVTNGTNKFDINAGNGISNYKVLVIDQNGCRDSVLSNVSIYPFPNFVLFGSDICPGESGKIITTLNQPSLSSLYTISYAWTRNGQTIPAPKWEELTYNEDGNYGLTLGIKGCNISNSTPIQYSPTPKIEIPLTYKHCYETNPPLTLSSNPFKKYSWQSEQVTIDTTQSIQVAPEKDTQYTLNVENNFGCKDSTLILVRKVCPPRLFVPNVITPESSDVNAGLRIFGANYTNFEITVFSRWGEVIFNSKDPKNAWNGEYISEKMPIGNYQWQVTYEGDTEEYKGPYKKTGDVAIVR